MAYRAQTRLICLWLCLATPTVSRAADPADEITSCLSHLKRGVNLPGWFWLNDQPVAELNERYSDQDLQRIKRLGLSYVRVPIDMANLLDEGAPSLLAAERLELLQRGLRKIQSYQLAMIVDIHSISQRDGGSNYSGPLGSDPGFTDRFCRFWTSLARQLSHFDPEWLVLEPMNEPVFAGQEEKWAVIQQRIIAAVRLGAPRHTILATGPRWSALDALLELEPLEDPNLIYNFHFYEPHLFTHQGATWSTDWLPALRNIPYPSSPSIMRAVIEKQQEERVVRHLREYGEQQWNSHKIMQRMRAAATYAERHGVTVLCNEWGCYRRFCSAEARCAWLTDVRSALETFDIGWCMWEWDGGFGLMNRDQGRPVADSDVVKALALNAKVD